MLYGSMGGFSVIEPIADKENSNFSYAANGVEGAILCYHILGLS